MEQELTAGLGEGQIAKLIENDEVHAGQLVGNPALPRVAGLGLEPVDEIDDVIESAPGACSDAASGDRDRQVSFAGSGAADQDGIALLGEEAAGGEIAHQGLVDWGTVELEARRSKGSLLDADKGPHSNAV